MLSKCPTHATATRFPLCIQTCQVSSIMRETHAFEASAHPQKSPSHACRSQPIPIDIIHSAQRLTHPSLKSHALQVFDLGISDNSDVE